MRMPYNYDIRRKITIIFSNMQTLKNKTLFFLYMCEKKTIFARYLKYWCYD